MEDFKRSSKNRKLQNPADNHANIIAIDLYVKVGSRIERPPIVKELREALTVPSKRPCRIITETFAYRFHCAIEPNRHTVILNQLPIARLCEGSASQGDDAWKTRFNPLHPTANRLGFQITKGGLATFIEDLADTLSFASFDLGINIDKGPAEF